MILMNGLKALANPTRLRVLELLKDPSAFDGPHDNDGRPLGVTAKDLLRKLRCSQPTLHEQMQVGEVIVGRVRVAEHRGGVARQKRALLAVV